MISSTSIPAWMDQLGWVLVHFLWQGALIGIVTWVGLILLKKFSAQIRYVFLFLSLLFCGLSPCLTWVLLDKDNQAHVESAIVPDFSSVKPPASAASIAETSLASDSGSYSVGQHASSRSWSLENLSRIIQAVLPYFVTLWCLGVITLSVRLAYGWIQLQNFCASGVPPKDQVWTERLTALANRMGLRLTILLLESALVEVPTVIGWLRPVLLVPATFFTGLPPDQIEAILAHELAHIRRYDYLVNLAQIAIETVLFYHPVVWWISRAIRQEREHCCDDLALQVVGDKIAYATALAALEESRSLPMAITLAATGGSLLQRIKRIAGIGAPKQANRGWTLMGGAFLIVLLIAVTAAILFPIWKAQHAPRLLFVMDRQPIDLSPQAQAKIIGQMEAIIRMTDSTSDLHPESFREFFYEVSPKDLKESGSYFQVTYPQEKTFSIPAGLIKAKDFYIGILNYDRLPGWPGGIFVVTAANHIIHLSSNSNLLDDQLEDFALDSEVYPHLSLEMRSNVTDGLFKYLDEAKEEDLTPELKLARAVKKGDLSRVKQLLNQGLDVQELLPGKYTLLFAAGGPEVAEFLIQKGVKVDARNERGETALWSICYNNNGNRPQEAIVPIARMLLKHGADPNAYNNNAYYIEWSPLMVARDGATVDALVEYGADVHAKVNGHGVLDELDIGYRELPYYQALAAHGLAIDNHENGIHLLNHAAYEGQLDIVKWLLDRGVDPNGIDPTSGSYDGFARKPLTEAARLDQAAVAQVLIQHGAKIDDDAVNCALRYGRTRILKVFRDAGANQFSELYYAVTQNAPIEKLTALLQQGMPADPPQDKHATPLDAAAGQGNLPVVKLLIQHGADPNRKLEKNTGDRQFDFAEWTPLATAASGGREDVVSYFIQNGAHPDADTLKLALYCFYHRGQRAPTDETYHRIIQQLVDAGACKSVPREQMADLLLWRGDGAGDWCDIPMLKILLAAGLDPTATNAGGMNAIDLVRARHDKITDAQTRDHLSMEIDLLKTFKAETDNNKEDKAMIVHVQNSDGSPLTGASAKTEGPNISADVTTGTDGLATISLPTARPQYLSVRVRKDGFVPKLITWSLDQPSFSLPSDFTLRKR